MKEHDKRNSKVAGITILIMGIFLIASGVAYALISQNLTGTKRQVITAGSLELELQEKNEIVIQNALPMHDEVGMIQKSFDFTLHNKLSEMTSYEIKLVDVTGDAERLDTSLVKYGLEKNGNKTIGTISDLTDLTLDSGTIPGGETTNYTLRFWIDSKVTDEDTIRNKTLSYRLTVSATVLDEEEPVPLYKEDILHGADPVLTDNLVPVTIENDGTVIKVDPYVKWYSYSNKQWANAVVLEEGAPEYENDEEIAQDDIESYFVWIPRYKYKIFNDGNYTELTSLNPDAPQTIEIEFENKATALSNGTAKDEWLSHPAFQAFDTNGFWVGKFESGYRDTSSTTATEVDAADATKLIIRPNTYSWRSITVGNAFKTSYDYLRNDESHMVKNTEWGAVAYLSHSLYGVNTEIYINNNNTYLTGCGGDAASAEETSTCSNAYGSKSDGIYNQTTTGNISGVFDMSGGAWDYVMGYNTGASTVGGDSGITSLYTDFFTNSEWDKYYDKYTSDSSTAYSNRILGDATGEMGPFNNYRNGWYNDAAYFVNFSEPWFTRGGNFSSTSAAGSFNFSNWTGSSLVNVSFRVVLAP